MTTRLPADLHLRQISRLDPESADKPRETIRMVPSSRDSTTLTNSPPVLVRDVPHVPLSESATTFSTNTSSWTDVRTSRAVTSRPTLEMLHDKSDQLTKWVKNTETGRMTNDSEIADKHDHVIDDVTRQTEHEQSFEDLDRRQGLSNLEQGSTESNWRREGMTVSPQISTRKGSHIELAPFLTLTDDVSRERERVTVGILDLCRGGGRPPERRAW